MEAIEDIRAVTYMLLDAAIAFAILAACLLLFILSYLLFFKRKSRKNQRLADHFFTLVGEISLCESHAELEQVFAQSYVQDMQRTGLRKKRRRAFMNRALVQFHKSVNGVAADNIKWLYEKLAFKADSLKQLSSHRWHKRAAAIQELAEMGQQDCITKIYRYTNHSNYYIRSEAQVAVVKLTGLEGLRFLNVISQPITQWQQLCLLQQLPPYATIKEDKLRTWLSSSNETVVELALKLVKAYSIFEAHDSLIHCLKHSSVAIRTEAILLLKDLGQVTTMPILKAHFSKAERSEKIAILQVLKASGTAEDITFLAGQLDASDRLLMNEVLSTIKLIQPEWENAISIPSGFIQKTIVEA
jgi:hypothetical protein